MQVVGNHSHARTEAFVCIGPEVELQWLDKQGQHYSELMNPDGQFFIFVISPHVPHAICNNSTSQPAMLIEYASRVQIQDDVERIQVTK